MNVDIYNSRTMYLFIYRYKIKKPYILAASFDARLGGLNPDGSFFEDYIVSVSVSDG